MFFEQDTANLQFYCERLINSGFTKQPKLYSSTAISRCFRLSIPEFKCRQNISIAILVLSPYNETMSERKISRLRLAIPPFNPCVLIGTFRKSKRFPLFSAGYG